KPKKKGSGKKADKSNQVSEGSGNENTSERAKKSAGRRNSEKDDDDIQIMEEFRNFGNEYNCARRSDGNSQPLRNFGVLEENEQDLQNISMSQPVALPSYVAERP